MALILAFSELNTKIKAMTRLPAVVFFPCQTISCMLLSISFASVNLSFISDDIKGNMGFKIRSTSPEDAYGNHLKNYNKTLCG